jgi:membrane protease subunit HflC
MKRGFLVGLGIFAVVALLIGSQALFIVTQMQQALVLQFGAPVRVVQTPGLQFKLPFVQDVRYFDKRLLDFDAEAQEVTLLDQRRMVVDAYARYRISDPLRFYQTTSSKAQFDSRLQAIMNSSLRNVLGQEPFSALLSARRGDITRKMRDQVISESSSFGVVVEDVRFVRADLHPDNSPAIFRRMQSERDREAREARAQGNEAAARIRAEAERERTVLMADAQRQAQILRGQGDAEATKTYAEAFGRDASFYDFWRSLEALRKALAEGTTLVLTPDSDFFRFFRDMRGTGEAGSRGETPRR